MSKIPNGRICITAIFLFFLILAGCSKQDTVYISSNSEQLNTETETSQSDAKDVSLEKETQDSNLNAQNKTNTTQTKDGSIVCYVYLCGAVVNPGVYQLSPDSRIFEAVTLAGGLLETAAKDSINQAQKVEDGQMIRIPTVKEYLADEQTSDLPSNSSMDKQKSDKQSGKVNINTATKEELLTLPGIGQSKVDYILAYREKNGSFKSVDEIMKIEGIKEGVFSKIKDSITVN